MSETFRDASERQFLEGLSAARGGLSEQSCPYNYSDDQSSTRGDSATARLNWAEGWQFGRFTMMQALRRDRLRDLKSAVERLTYFQSEYAEACRVSNQGLLQSGLKSIRAKKRSNEIAANIMASREYKLLQDLQYEFYLPWRHSEAPYEFKLFDRQLAVFGYDGHSERVLRRLLNQYGDRHGVRTAWEEYVRAEPLRYPPSRS